jgi:hypothetical protein
MTRPTKDEVDEVLRMEAEENYQGDYLAPFVEVLAAEVRAQRADNERLRAELAHNAEREQQAYALFGEQHRAEVKRLRATACEYDCKCGPGFLCRVHRSIVGELDTQLTELREAAEGIKHSIEDAADDLDEHELLGAIHEQLSAVLAKVTPRVEVNERGHYVVPSDIDVNARLDQLAKVTRTPTNEAGPPGSSPPIAKDYEWVNGSLHRKVPPP